MTPYIQQQLKKLCDNPNWYDDMLWVYTYADKESLELDLMETLIRNEEIYQAYKHTHPPNKQNKVYHLTANNPNTIHLITNPGILHI